MIFVDVTIRNNRRWFYIRLILNKEKLMEDKNKKATICNESSHEKHVRAGEAGAEARWGHTDGKEGHSHGGKSASSESSHEKHVKAGEAGAEARWGHKDGKK